MHPHGSGRSRDVHSAYPWNAGGRVIVVSNRGPVEHQLDGSGHLKAGPGPGGVVAALSGARCFVDVTWVAAAITDGDRQVARWGTPIELGEGCRLHLVALPKRSYDLYYNVFTNPVLWYLQHDLWDRLDRPQHRDQLLDAWEEGYRPVNETLGEAVCQELARPDSSGAVLFQDYHLYLAPRYVRQRAPDAALQHFVHIPWPAPEAWRVLPWGLVKAMCDGLLACDVVRFQTRESLHHFLLTCLEFLPGAHIDPGGERIRYEGRWTRLRADPIALDVAGLRRQAASPEVAAYRRQLAAPKGVATILRVDRLDPVKNLLTGFQAYELLLQREPSLQGSVRFLTFLVPTRPAIPEYQHYAKEVFTLVDHINRRYGSQAWRPIEVFYENNHAQALAGMSLYDVLLVNSLADGMNLVSKEGPIVNRRQGALVLSTRAGSYHELKEGAIAIEPEDVEGTADALHRALVLPAAERRRRARLLRTAASARDLESWLRGQLEDLAIVALESRRRRELVAMPEDYRVTASA